MSNKEIKEMKENIRIHKWTRVLFTLALGIPMFSFGILFGFVYKIFKQK